MPEPDPPTEATSPRASVSEAWKLWTGYRRLLEKRKRLPERGPAYVAAYAADHVAFLLEQKQLLERELREQFGVDVMHPRPRSAGAPAEFGAERRAPALCGHRQGAGHGSHRGRGRDPGPGTDPAELLLWATQGVYESL